MSTTSPIATGYTTDFSQIVPLNLEAPCFKRTSKTIPEPLFLCPIFNQSMVPALQRNLERYEQDCQQLWSRLSLANDKHSNKTINLEEKLDFYTKHGHLWTDLLKEMSSTSITISSIIAFIKNSVRLDREAVSQAIENINRAENGTSIYQFFIRGELPRRPTLWREAIDVLTRDLP